MRTIALGEAWVRAGGSAGMISCEAPAWLVTEAEARGLEVRIVDASRGSREDALAVREVVAERNAAWVVLDGYQFGPDYQRALEPLRIAVVDDHAVLGPHHADVVIDQNLGADQQSYEQLAPDALLLLGSDYALLRSEFAALRPPVRKRSAGPPRALLSVGGSPSPPLRDLMREAAEILAAREIDVDTLEGGDRRDIARRMSRADVAVSAAGSTVWELCCLKVPPLLMVVADNQETVATRLVERGAAILLGPWQHVVPRDIADGVSTVVADSERWQAVSVRAGELVDGHGAGRVVEQLVLRC